MNKTDIYRILFITLCVVIVAVYYYRKLKQQKDEIASTLDCKELERTGKPSVMIVDIPQEAEDKVRQYIHDSTDLDLDAHCKFERNGNQLKVSMDKDLDFYDTACIANEFAWEADGLDYGPKAHYNIGKLQIGDTILTNTEVIFFVRPYDEPHLVNFATKDGKQYQYDLGNGRVKELQLQESEQL